MIKKNKKIMEYIQKNCYNRNTGLQKTVCASRVCRNIQRVHLKCSLENLVQRALREYLEQKEVKR
jgi:hypothetical protein